MPMRADALLSRYGYCSRKEARAWLREGRLSHGGVPVGDPAGKVDPFKAEVDGVPVEFPGGILVKLHKPAGYVCSHDEGDGPTVYELLPRQWMRRKPVPTVAGRLDKDTTGLVLVTDDHQLVHRLISPKHKVAKIYHVVLGRPPDNAVAAKFASGTLLLKGEEKPCRPASLTGISDSTCQVTLAEGKYHQVKRMFAACGYHVEKLHRLRIGEWELGELEEGKWVAVDGVLNRTR